MLKTVVGTTSELEVAAAYVNPRKGIPHSIALTKLDYPQHQTPLELDNAASCGVLTNTLMHERSKVTCMIYFRLKYWKFRNS